MTSRTLEHRLARLDAIRAVHNLMGRYCYFHAANNHRGCLELSALDTPGVSVELPFGAYKERSGLERLYLGFFANSDADPAGRMHMHTMTTPVVEVAEDLQTVKGVWMAPGHATDKYQGSDFKASWRWVKYGCVFVKEAEAWKIWRLRLYGFFATPYDKSWVESQPTAAQGPPPLPPHLAPDEPARPFWQYRDDIVVSAEPEPPTAYEVFDEADAY